jgi:hypothetical protein
VVVGGGVAAAFGPQMYLASLGLFVEPISAETGFSRTTVTAAASVAAVGMAVLIATLGPYVYPAVAGFDQLAARDELAAAEVLSDLAESRPPARAGQPTA